MNTPLYFIFEASEHFNGRRFSMSNFDRGKFVGRAQLEDNWTSMIRRPLKLAGYNLYNTDQLEAVLLRRGKSQKMETVIALMEEGESVPLFPIDHGMNVFAYRLTEEDQQFLEELDGALKECNWNHPPNTSQRFNYHLQAA